jgi:hypothetical protein
MKIYDISFYLTLLVLFNIKLGQTKTNPLMRIVLLFILSIEISDLEILGYI